jgi:hypothetical protein
MELKITPQRSSPGPSCQKWAAGIAGYSSSTCPPRTPHLKPDAPEPNPHFTHPMLLHKHPALLRRVGNIVFGVLVLQISTSSR